MSVEKGDDETKIVAETEYEDENTQDWKAFNRGNGSSAEVIPKRGDKEFEIDGTSYQTTLIEDARNEMYLALDGNRGLSAKQLLLAVWIPEKKQALVPVARGIFFKDMGKPANVFINAKNKKQSMWLNEVETVYLVERGSLIIYLGNSEFNQYLANGTDDDFDYLTKLHQMTLSHLYSLALSKEGMIDKYQIYSYLRRLGYVVQDFSIINDSCNQMVNYNQHIEANSLYLSHSLFKLVQSFSPIGHFFTKWMIKVGLFARPFSSSLHFESKHYFNYTSVLKILQFIPSYRSYDSISNHTTPSFTKEQANNDYKLTFNVWKPSVNFSKKNPPIPDFQLCLINSQRQRFPSLSQIQNLFNEINYRFPNQHTATETKKNPVKKLKNSKSEPTKRELREQRQKERQSKLDPKIRQRNEYLKAKDNLLRHGSSGRNVILAVIDSGIISFTRLCELDFTLSDATARSKLNSLYPQKLNDHGTMWLET